MEMKITSYDPYVDPEQANRLEVELASLETVLQISDFVTIHLPLTKETAALTGHG